MNELRYCVVVAVGLVTIGMGVDYLSGPPTTHAAHEGLHWRDNRRMEERYRFKPRSEVTGWNKAEDWTLWDSKSRRVR